MRKYSETNEEDRHQEMMEEIVLLRKATQQQAKELKAIAAAVFAVANELGDRDRAVLR